MSRGKSAPGRERRPKGTGSITRYPTRCGSWWRFQAEGPVDPARPEAGTRVHSRAGFATAEEAGDALTLVLADVIRKAAQPLGRDTFDAYGQRWLDGHAVGNGTRI